MNNDYHPLTISIPS